MDRIKLLLLGLGVSTLTAACTEDINSTDVKTHGMQAHFKAIESGGDTTQVTADLRVNGGETSNDYIDTKGEDELSASASDQTVKLSKFTVGLGDGVEYEGELDEKAEDAEFTFSFMRGPEDDDAPSSTVTLPPAFELVGLETDGEVPRGSDLTLTWDAPKTGDKVRYYITSEDTPSDDTDGCIWSSSVVEQGTNDGSVTLKAADFKPKAGKEDATCGAKLYVELVRTGTLDPAFGDGEVEGIRRRWISFVTVPAAAK